MTSPKSVRKRHQQLHVRDMRGLFFFLFFVFVLWKIKKPTNLVSGRNSAPSSEIFLSYMDAHDGFVYSSKNNSKISTTALETSQGFCCCFANEKALFVSAEIWY